MVIIRMCIVIVLFFKVNWILNNTFSCFLGCCLYSTLTFTKSHYKGDYGWKYTSIIRVSTTFIRYIFTKL